MTLSMAERVSTAYMQGAVMIQLFTTPVIPLKMVAKAAMYW
jgi:hypothetical protein